MQRVTPIAPRHFASLVRELGLEPMPLAAPLMSAARTYHDGPGGSEDLTRRKICKVCRRGCPPRDRRSRRTPASSRWHLIPGQHFGATHLWDMHHPIARIANIDRQQCAILQVRHATLEGQKEITEVGGDHLGDAPVIRRPFEAINESPDLIALEDTAPRFRLGNGHVVDARSDSLIAEPAQILPCVQPPQKPQLNLGISEIVSAVQIRRTCNKRVRSRDIRHREFLGILGHEAARPAL